MNNIRIIKLEQKDFPNGKTVSYHYTSDRYYKLSISENSGWNISLEEKEFEKPFKKSLLVEIFQTDREDLECYKAELNEKEAGIISFSHQKWNNVLRIHDLYVSEDMQRKGIGAMLINIAKERASKINARAITLETQTSNFYAIEFYKKMGFKLTGLDMVSYSNNDVESKEVRVEMGYLLK